MSDEFDVAVIGGGPGGYVAAIRAAQLGFKTACVDKWLNAAGQTVYGGTCLNVGCIPSKALLESSHHYESARLHFAEHGVEVGNVKLNLAAMQKRKAAVVDTLTGGIAGLFKKNGIAALGGAASFAGEKGGAVEIDIASGAKKKNSQRIRAKNVIIATGSVPREIPPAPLDGEVIVDSEGALAFDKTPKRLGVVGAGVIGLELGSVWRRLGAEVTVLEAMPEFLAAADAAVSTAALKILKKQGLDIRLGAAVSSAKKVKGGAQVEWTQGGKKERAVFDKLVVAVGRRPFADGLNLKAVGLQTNPQGMIEVDGECRTARPNIFAVGDVVRGPMLAHKAEDEGAFVAEIIAGQKPHINYEVIPWVIYTHPEIAWAGKSERELKAAGVPHRAGSFPFLANGRARGMGETDGFVKIVAHAETDRVLGAHIIGAAASDLIAECVAAMEYGASAEDIARTVHAHPTLSEAVREAALGAGGRALHI